MKNTQQLVFLSSAILLNTSLCHSEIKENQNKNKTNVVLILADDLGYGDLSCYGQKKFSTPNIDRLALEGVRMTQCYSGSTVSAPSRSSLLTGLHTGHTFIRGNREIQPEGQYPIPAGANTIFKLFKDAGYTTGAFGKWGLGYPGSSGDPNNQYVDQFFGYNCQMLAHNYYPDHLWDNNQRVELNNNKDGGYGTYSQDLIHKKCLDFLDRMKKDEPFFLFVPNVLPHAELVVPEDSIIQKYKGMYPEVPFKGMDSGPKYRKGGYASQAYPRATFAAMVSRLDIYVGQIIDKLKEKGLYENTLIIVTSDNGPHNEGGADPEFFNSNGIYRGIKRDLYEGGIRVPMIAVWEGKIQAGTENNFMCTFWDLMPTFAKLTSRAKTKSDGINILPTLTGKGMQQQHESLYFEFHEMGGRQALRKGNWKLIRLDIKNNGGRYELYNLASDPSENHNIISQYPEILKEMKEMMENARTTNSDFRLTGVD